MKGLARASQIRRTAISVSYTHLDVYKRQVYHHREIDRERFEKYRRRLSPYCSVASLYFWAVAGGAIPEMRDYAPKKKGKQNLKKGKVRAT